MNGTSLGYPKGSFTEFLLMLNHITCLLDLQMSYIKQLKLFYKQKNQRHHFILQRKMPAAGAEPGTPDRIIDCSAHPTLLLNLTSKQRSKTLIQNYGPSGNVFLSMKRQKNKAFTWDKLGMEGIFILLLELGWHSTGVLTSLT